jgi:hypothetical protein
MGVASCLARHSVAVRPLQPRHSRALKPFTVACSEDTALPKRPKTSRGLPSSAGEVAPASEGANTAGSSQQQPNGAAAAQEPKKESADHEVTLTAAAARGPEPASTAPAAQSSPLDPLKLHRWVSTAANVADRLARQATARLHRKRATCLVSAGLGQGARTACHALWNSYMPGGQLCCATPQAILPMGPVARGRRGAPLRLVLVPRCFGAQGGRRQHNRRRSRRRGVATRQCRHYLVALPGCPSPGQADRSARQ